jgi:hypothetical protein
MRGRIGITNRKTNALGGMLRVQNKKRWSIAYTDAFSGKNLKTIEAHGIITIRSIPFPASSPHYFRSILLDLGVDVSSIALYIQKEFRVSIEDVHSGNF